MQPSPHMFMLNGMKKSVSNLLAKKIIDSLKVAGMKSDEINKILIKSNVSLHEIEQQNGRIDQNSHYRLLIEALKQEKVKIQMLSYALEHNIIESSYRNYPELFGFLMNQSSLANALDAFSENRFIIGNCDLLNVKKNKEEIKIEYINEGPIALGDFSALGNFMLISGVTNIYNSNSILEVGLTDHHRLDARLINDLFQTKCKFDCNSNYMIIKNNISDKEISFNSILHTMQQSYLSQKKSDFYTNTPFIHTVCEIIENTIYSLSLMQSESNILETICSKLNMSRWTLNERLKYENTSFTELLKKIKIKMSCSLLSNTDKSIQEISELVCFSSISVFSRFFKSNLGVSPLTYRKKRETTMNSSEYILNFINPVDIYQERSIVN